MLPTQPTTHAKISTLSTNHVAAAMTRQYVMISPPKLMKSPASFAIER